MTIYAIKKNDEILVHTIAQWRRATLVTYLTEDMRRPVFNNDTDESVETLWSAFADGGEVVEVSVAEGTGVDKSPPYKLAIAEAIKAFEQEEYSIAIGILKQVAA